MGHLRALETKGFIRRTPRASRAIELTRQAKDSGRGLPLKGRVAAGTWHEAIEQDERVDFGDLFKRKELYVLQINGDSMIDAHIADGDYVVVEPRETAERGEMVVARTDDGEATLKYWFPERNRIRLQPANSAMQPIFVKSARVLGVVVGVVRKLS
jgi:repressor LexA